ncbi:Global transcription regulator sge1 like protein [Verticillium longisporum]|nr:Global transcription regulator sge1 like protein [Verticillium longisporum]
MLVDQPLSRRHSTAYDLSNSSHAIGLTQTMSNNPVDPIRNMSHPFMQATPVYGNSGRLQEPVQHSDAFPSPRTLPQQEPGLDGSQQHSASLKLEGEESHLQHNNSWGTYDVAATHDVFLGGTNTDQSQPFLNPEGEEEQYDENNPPPTWPPGSNNSMGRLKTHVNQAQRRQKLSTQLQLSQHRGRVCPRHYTRTSTPFRTF